MTQATSPVSIALLNVAGTLARRDPEGVLEITRQGAINVVGSWRDRGCEYASIIDGVPRPWAPESFKLIFADAEQRGVELLSLANGDHVKSILAAILEYIALSLIASQTKAELRKLGPAVAVARGGNA